ncbi:conjugal transfer protein TrbL [Enemella evansiae]|uniref:Conjugal transfer protein TrbL n=1 Tax=Enemella evansiae TaxID=2016499 RepID=A0A255FYQ5_9ACTN|nr:conjugal transfer protein TrbL [Enemella evansiae]OYO08838.1 conjugal transfer protein TrbL [Enemella evansiae]
MGVCDVPVISTVCDTAGEAAASLISAPFDWLASAMGEAAGWMFTSVWTVFDTTTLVDVTGSEYVAVYNLLFGIAVFVMLSFFCLQLITGMIRREPAALSRAALGLGKSVLGSFVVITITALLLEIVDQLSVGIIQAAGETTESMGDKIAILVAGLTALNIGAPGVGAILTIFLAALAIAAAAIVWLSLLVRKALLLVAIVLAPFAFSGASWDATRGWISKWAMFVIALIFSKLVLVVILLVAVTQVSAPIDGDLSNVADPLAGIVLMALAGFAPYMTYRFLSFIGFDLYNSMGSEQETKNALNRPMPTPGKPQGDQPKKVLDGGGGKKSGGGGGDDPPPPGGGGGDGPRPTPDAAPASTGSTSASTGTAAKAAPAAGPAAAVVIGAEAVKAAATAGPKAGKALAGEAESAADGAGQSGRSDVTPQAPPPSQPLPKNPNNTPPPPKPSRKE